MVFDISGLSDKELSDLKKSVEAEYESRRDGRLYKGNLGYGYERLNKFLDIWGKEYALKGHVKPKDCIEQADPSPSPMRTIDKDLKEICDLVLGNYTIKERRGFPTIIRNGSLVEIRPELYSKMFREMMGILDKYMEIVGKEDSDAESNTNGN